MDKIKTANILLSFVIFLLLINTCTSLSVNKKLISTEKQITVELPKIISNHDSAMLVKFGSITEANNEAIVDDINGLLDNALYNFLIYEDDLDKNKISLSEIKNLLLEKNRNNNEDSAK